MSVLDGGTALVTGATGGLGHAIARALAGRGASVVVSGRRADVLEPLASELGGRAIAADLAIRGEAERLLAEAGEIDVLVNNAALPASGEIEGYSPEQIDRALEVNLRVPVILTRLLLPELRRRGRGHIVFVSSLSGKTATARSALYSATKFGVRGFAFGLRQDLHSTPVGVSVVSPGPIRDAGMFADSGVKAPPGSTRTPADVAAAVLRAIDRNAAEVVVAPPALRAATALGVLSPSLTERFNRLTGTNKIADRVGGGQRDKR
ncbi:MAG TPA: SDR family NAD(P)-dependent oxidoreductase [Solirubrobacteraceae bacterium]|nr:SDR family NAD(P)-dependent oxidoreductase [Solirubrobacteraceae bacterium]